MFNLTKASQFSCAHCAWEYAIITILLAVGVQCANATNGFWGEFGVSGLENSDRAAILQGLSSGDLAGSSLLAVPDFNGDGIAELLVASRFGKPYNVELGQGIGFGDGFLIYGDAVRLQGVQLLSAVGAGQIPGLRLPGIRAVFTDPAGNFHRPTLPATNGLSSITVVDDMDGDGLPEMVFAFPRVESVSLATADSRVQHPLLFPDLPGMGSLEWDSWDAMSETWMGNTAQFTRGGIVIVSSHNLNLQQPELLNRKFDRRIDLHEVGQLFGNMSRPSLEMYVRKVTPPSPPTPFEDCADCEPQLPEGCTCGHDCESGCGDCGGIPDNPAETPYQSVVVAWDVWLGGGSSLMQQGPGGFHQLWTNVPADPPLANPAIFTAQLPFPDYIGPCEDPLGCEIQHRWYLWTEEAMCMVGIPGTIPDYACLGSWIAFYGMPCLSAWTGFYARTAPVDYTIGARILGQEQNDLFGTSVDYDGTFLYVSAPQHTATSYDVPELLEDRPVSGVIYRLRANLEAVSDGLSRLQLWQEPDRSWPQPDAENQARYDYTMPTPHQYIIETVGSIRGNAQYQAQPDPAVVVPNDCCNPDQQEVLPADEVYGYVPYPPSSSGYWVDRTPQIVGPHENAEIGLIRSLGDVDDDGIARDFAVGCPNAWEDLSMPSDAVGAVFVLYSRPDPDSNYLLERIASEGAGRIRGVWIKGTADAPLGRAFDRAGDFNGDGVDDVIIGSPEAFGGGEAIVLLGSRTLQSPAAGWTIDQLLATGQAIRFAAAEAGDQAGFNVAGAGDVNADGYDDVLIAAPGAESDAGKVYLIYGSPDFAALFVDTGGDGVPDTWINRDYSLADAGTPELSGAVFNGRPASRLGGGVVTRNLYHSGNVDVYSRGLAALDDVDGDGIADFAISAVKAQPNGLADAGEVYILYGGLIVDCNGNGIPDDEDIANGTSEDCNENGVPDECDVISGYSEDCDGDEVPDECQVWFFSDTSPQLGPIGTGVPQSYTVALPPPTWFEVELRCAAIGDFAALAEWVDVDINGVPVGRVLMRNAHDCPPQPDVDTLTVSADTYNDAVAGGDAVIGMVASPAVDPNFCATSFIQVTVEYQAVTPDDCNGNGVPDLCDILSGYSEDENGNGIPDECELAALGDLNCDGAVNAFDIDPFVLAVVDRPAYEAQFPDCNYLNGDLDRDGDVDSFDIDPFVALLTGG